jgi:AraC-like DNA-binding protein
MPRVYCERIMIANAGAEQPELSMPVRLGDWQFQHLCMSVAQYAPNVKLSNHAHERGEICLLVQGQYSERIGTQTIEYHPFHSAYHPPGFEHSLAVSGRGMRFLSLSFDGALFQDVDFYKLDLALLKDLSGRRHTWNLLNLFRMMPSLLPIETEAAAVGIILDIVSTAKKLLPERRSLSAAREFIFDHYKSNLTLTEVAQAVRLHPAYLGQLFIKEMKQTLGDYVNDLRVRAAAEELSCGTLSLAEIAMGNGFYDQSHFSRVFKQKVGISPGTFRLQHRGV